MRPIKYIILHCTASPQTQTVENILGYWKNVLGWKTPGYHFMIKPDGSYVNLVPIEKPSNGVKGYNSNSINISYIGGVSTSKTDPVNAPGTPVDNRTAAQRKTMQELVEQLSFKFPSAIIQGHRDFSPDKNRNGVIESSEWVKSCPSFSAAAWLREIAFKSKAAPVMATVTGVNIRTGPGVQFPKAAPTLEKGVTVKKLGEDGDWIYVSVTGTDVKGFVSKQFIQ